MFDTDLDREYSIAATLGLQPRRFFDAGVAGALCDNETRSRLEAIGEVLRLGSAEDVRAARPLTSRIDSREQTQQIGFPILGTRWAYACAEEERELEAGGLR